MRYVLSWVVMVLAATAASGQQRSLVLDAFELEDVRMTSAFAMWSAQSGIPLTVDWKALEADGIDTERPLTLSLRGVHAMTVLDLMMQYCTADGFSTLVLESYPSFIQMTTKRQALRRPVLRVYNIRDLTMDVPQFTDAPSFSLTDALSNTTTGGGGGGGAGEGLFGDDEEEAQEERPLTRRERGEALVQLIQDTIEPDIWIDNGGEFASIRYFDGRLIVRAPQYVHGQVTIKLNE